MSKKEVTKKKYYIAKGLTHLAGKKLKKGEKTVELSEAEALYDLSNGRISEKPFPEQKPAAPKDDKSNNAGSDESQNAGAETNQGS